MQDPDEIAIRVVSGFTGDEYWIDMNAAIEAVALALRSYGAACAAEQKEKDALIVENWPDFRQFDADNCAGYIRGTMPDSPSRAAPNAEKG